MSCLEVFPIIGSLSMVLSLLPIIVLLSVIWTLSTFAGYAGFTFHCILVKLLERVFISGFYGRSVH